MDPEEFVRKAVEDFPSGAYAKEFVLRTVGVMRWGFDQLKVAGVNISEAALETLDAVQGWAEGRLEIDAVEKNKETVGPALIGARGVCVTARIPRFECEKDVLNLTEWLIGACIEMAEAIARPGSHEAKIVLGKFYGLVQNGIPRLIEMIDKPRRFNYHLNMSVGVFFDKLGQEMP